MCRTVWHCVCALMCDWERVDSQAENVFMAQGHRLHRWFRRESVLVRTLSTYIQQISHFSLRHAFHVIFPTQLFSVLHFQIFTDFFITGEGREKRFSTAIFQALSFCPTLCLREDGTFTSPDEIFSHFKICDNKWKIFFTLLLFLCLFWPLMVFRVITSKSGQ